MRPGLQLLGTVESQGPAHFTSVSSSPCSEALGPLPASLSWLSRRFSSCCSSVWVTKGTGHRAARSRRGRVSDVRAGVSQCAHVRRPACTL